ncbi:MAG: helix-turn-helix domain-containing protein, partial [Candidatus Sumerlaeota bacterium]|nr:helix-turn-helix domain-containing protein [Candidatus Sumerlaeota bacterium]
MKQAVMIVLTEEERRTLEQWARGLRTPLRLVTRAKIILHASAGMKNKDIATALNIGRDTAGTWR